MKPTLIMHVNYCEQGQSLDDMCRKAVDWGFDGIEFRRQRFGVTESVEDYLDALAKAVTRSGMKEVIFGSPGPDLMSADGQTRERELQAAMDFYRLAAARFKTGLCNTLAGELLNPDKSAAYSHGELHGSAIATKEQWQWAVEGFRVLGRLAEQLGMRLGFETHAAYLHDTPEAALRLVEGINSPAIGITFDYANCSLFPHALPPGEMIAKLTKHIVYVHLKNYVTLPNRAQLRTGLGDGQINNRELLRLLKQAGYNGPICIEAPRAGDREFYAPQDFAYLNSLLAALCW